MNRLLPIASGLLLALTLAACSSGGCENNQNSIPMAGFYNAANGESLTVSGLSVMGIGAPGDSLLLDPKRNTHQVYLPFRGSDTSCSFSFAYGQFADVVEFQYRAIPYFDGEECGAMWRYEITDVSWRGLLIDSVAVTDPLITNMERERIMIFLNVPETEDDEEEEEDKTE